MIIIVIAVGNRAGFTALVERLFVQLSIRPFNLAAVYYVELPDLKVST